jgi:hypothetical protein
MKKCRVESVTDYGACSSPLDGQTGSFRCSGGGKGSRIHQSRPTFAIGDLAHGQEDDLFITLLGLAALFQIHGLLSQATPDLFGLVL